MSQVERIIFPRLEAYGDGGFRIAGARHDGSVLIINGAAASWPVSALGEATVDSLERALQADPPPELILLGCGPVMAHPPADVLHYCRERALGLEVMDTGAACRVYATLVDEGRRIAAALIAI